MQALIFGVTGQDGYYLRELLMRAGVSVFGVARSGGDARLNVSDPVAVRQLIRQVQPDYIFHLAAESSTAPEYLWSNHEAIATGTLAILDAVDQELPTAKVLLVGSGLQFVNHGDPLNEDAALDYSSQYALTRNYSLCAGRYFRQKGLKVYFAYLFNHDSPLRTTRHLNMKVVEAAIAAARGNRDKLMIGDLNAEKEFNFAGDVAEALWCLIQQDQFFECVVGSGQGHPVREWVELCYQHVGLNWRDHVATNENYQGRYRRLISDPARLRQLHWQPTMNITQLAKLMMEQRLASSPATRSET